MKEDCKGCDNFNKPICVNCIRFDFHTADATITLTDNYKKEEFPLSWAGTGN